MWTLTQPQHDPPLNRLAFSVCPLPPDCCGDVMGFIVTLEGCSAMTTRLEYVCATGGGSGKGDSDDIVKLWELKAKIHALPLSGPHRNIWSLSAYVPILSRQAPWHYTDVYVEFDRIVPRGYIRSRRQISNTKQIFLKKHKNLPNCNAIDPGGLEETIVLISYQNSKPLW